jgi:uncharacterized coiled-coil DUF342 family protein
MPETPETRIEKLSQELNPLKEERDKLNSEAKKWANKRNTLHEKIKTLRKDASIIKEKRDAINEKVQNLKNLRNQMKTERGEKHEKILGLQEKIRALNENKPEGNMRQVEREIEEIDWRIQTSSLPVKEEQELVNQVRNLESQLVVQKQMEKVGQKLFELRTEERKLGLEAKAIHEKLSELAEQSQKFHVQMIDVLEKAKELQVEADEAHQKHVDARQHAQELHQKCVELMEKIKVIQKELKETADKKQAERQSKLKNELEEKALAKLKRGEKLMWEEFQVLAEKGLV